jgi:hypothetical protein
MPSLLLDNSMSSTNEWCNVEDKNNKYISPIEFWIEEACSSTGDLWHFVATLLHDDPCPMARPFQVIKKVPMSAYYRFDISLFWLATKHKVKIHGNDEFMC